MCAICTKYGLDRLDDPTKLDRKTQHAVLTEVGESMRKIVEARQSAAGTRAATKNDVSRAHLDEITGRILGFEEKPRDARAEAAYESRRRG